MGGALTQEGRQLGTARALVGQPDPGKHPCGAGGSAHSRVPSQALTPEPHYPDQAPTLPRREPRAASLSNGQEVAGDRAAPDLLKTFLGSLQP